MFSKEYLAWVANRKDSLPPLTNSQHKFAELIFENLKNIGNMDDVLLSIAKYIQDGRPTKDI